MAEVLPHCRRRSAAAAAPLNLTPARSTLRLLVRTHTAGAPPTPGAAAASGAADGELANELSAGVRRLVASDEWEQRLGGLRLARLLLGRQAGDAALAADMTATCQQLLEDSEVRVRWAVSGRPCGPAGTGLAVVEREGEWWAWVPWRESRCMAWRRLQPTDAAHCIDPSRLALPRRPRLAPRLPRQVGELLRTLCEQQGIAVWEQVRPAPAVRRALPAGGHPCPAPLPSAPLGWNSVLPRLLSSFAQGRASCRGRVLDSSRPRACRPAGPRPHPGVDPPQL